MTRRPDPHREPCTRQSAHARAADVRRRTKIGTSQAHRKVAITLAPVSILEKENDQ